MLVNRGNTLTEVLRQNLSIEETERHLGYQLTQEELECIRNTAIDVLKNMPQKAFNYSQISTIWAVIIQDHSIIPVSDICGYLLFINRKLLFVTVLFQIQNQAPVKLKNGQF